MPLPIRDAICRAHHFPANREGLEARCQLLRPHERDLFRAVVIEDRPIVAVAALMGEKPNAVRKRLARLTRRMGGRLFGRTLKALDMLRAEDAELAVAAFCQGRGVHELCRRYSLSYHHMRRRLDALREVVEALARAAAAPSPEAAKTPRPVPHVRAPDGAPATVGAWRKEEAEHVR